MNTPVEKKKRGRPMQVRDEAYFARKKEAQKRYAATAKRRKLEKKQVENLMKNMLNQLDGGNGTMNSLVTSKTSNATMKKRAHPPQHDEERTATKRPKNNSQFNAILKNIRQDLHPHIITHLRDRAKKGNPVKSVDEIKPKILKRLAEVLGHTTTGKALTPAERNMIVKMVRGMSKENALATRPRRGRPAGTGPQTKTIKDLENTEYNVLLKTPEYKNMDKTVLNKVPKNTQPHLLPYLLYRHLKKQPINTFDKLRKHVRDKLFMKLATTLGYNLKKKNTITQYEKDVVARMLQGETKNEALSKGKQTQGGVRFTKNGKSVQVRTEHVQKMMERLPELSFNNVAHRIGQNKLRSKMKNKRPIGEPYFDFHRNKFFNSNGVPYNGEDFANTYHQLVKKRVAANMEKNSGNASSSNNNTSSYGGNITYSKEFHPSLHNNVVALLSKKKTMKYADILYPQRLKVQGEILDAAFKGDKSPYRMNGAKKAIIDSLSVGGELANRPLFIGNVGSPFGGRGRQPTKTPIQEIDANHDGCGDMKKWPHGMGYSLSPHQAVVQGVCALVAMGRINPPGFLAFHSVGAGKTVMSLGCIVAFWNTNKCIIPASPRSNTAAESNDLLRLATESTRYFPWFKSDLVGEHVMNNHVYQFDEYPFASGIARALEQLRTRLRYGHAIKGHPAAHILDDTHLLNTYTTIVNMFGGTREKNPKHTMTKRLENYVFICDELQMLLHVPSSEASRGAEYAKFAEWLSSRRNPATTFVLGLTATPGESEEEVVEIFKFLTGNPNNHGVPNNLISSAYVSGDTAFFPKVKIIKNCTRLVPVSNAENNNNNNNTNTLVNPFEMYTISYLANMSRRHNTHTIASSLLSQMNKPARKPIKMAFNQTNEGKLRDEDKFRRHFLKSPRQLSEYVLISKSTAADIQKIANTNASMNENFSTSVNTNATLFDQLKSHAFDPESNVIYARTKNWVPEGGKTTGRTKEPYHDSIYLLSPKTIGIINALIHPKNDGVHFVYGTDWTTLKLMAHVLQTRYGWKPYRPDRTTSSSSAPRFGFINDIPEGNKTRYLDHKQLAKNTNAIVDNSFTPQLKTRIKQDGKYKVSSKTTLLRDIQDDRNKHGDICKVVFATLDSYKGVNTKNLRHIHCITALPSWIDLLQLVGRGTRFKGHCGLKKSKRDVKIHTWRLEPPAGLNVKTDERMAFPDDFIYDMALKRYKDGFKKILTTMRNASIDKHLYGHRFSALEELEDQLSLRCDRSLDDQINKRPIRLIGKNKYNKMGRRAEKKGSTGVIQMSKLEKMNENELEALITKHNVNTEILKNSPKNVQKILKSHFISRKTKNNPVTDLTKIKPQVLLRAGKTLGIVSNSSKKLDLREKFITTKMIGGMSKNNANKEYELQAPKRGRKPKTSTS